MRTNIVIDPRLMKAAQSATGLPTKKKVVEEGLKLLAATKAQDRHPAYLAWTRRRKTFAAPLSNPAIQNPAERSSDPFKAALDAKYRR